MAALVSFPAPPGPEATAALQGVGLQVHPLLHVPAAVVRGTAVQLGAAAALPGVLGVELDRPLELYLDQTVSIIGAASVRDQLGIDGTGVTIAVVDSGIDATHADLAFGSKVVQNVKILGEEHYAPGVSLAVEDVPNTDTTSGHGTHVAGIAAGSGAASGGLYRGVAPGAKLVGVGAGEAVSMVTAAVGLDWVVRNKDRYGIKVVNNSWGDGAIAYDPNSVLNRATKAVHDAGITVVQAAGNDGSKGPGWISRYCIPDWVICVGASNKLGALAGLSSRGSSADPVAQPDLLAPGEWVSSARAVTGTASNANSTVFDFTDPANPRVMPTELWPYYTVKSGTSMSAPHVAGVVALLLQANPRLTPDAVREVLRRTATPIADCQPYACGAGVVNARAGVDLVAGVKNIKKITKHDGFTFWAREVAFEFDGTVGASLFGTAHDLRTFPVAAGADSADVAIQWSSAVNDLDLTVRRPDGSVAGTANLSIAQLGATEHVESLRIDAPVAGTWTMDTSGFLSAGQAYRGTASVLYPL